MKTICIHMQSGGLVLCGEEKSEISDYFSFSNDEQDEDSNQMCCKNKHTYDTL